MVGIDTASPASGSSVRKKFCSQTKFLYTMLSAHNGKNIFSVADVGTRATGPGIAVVGANEYLLRWDIKKSQLISRWRDGVSSAQITAISRSLADPDVYAIGYEDGAVKIWDSRTETVVIGFNGHKSAVVAISFDRSGARLASGARDTDIIIWDLIAELGLFKLRGHKNEIVALTWLYPNLQKDTGSDGESELNISSDTSLILSASKDATLKLWDITSQHCLETRVAQTNGECWAMSVTPDQTGCITAGNDGEMQVWSIDFANFERFKYGQKLDTTQPFLQDRGIILRAGKDRPTGLHFHPRADYFAVHGSDKALEIWRIKSAAEVQKTLQRKKKRRRERRGQSKAGDDGSGTLTTTEPEGELTAQITDYFVPYTIVRTTGKVAAIDWIEQRLSKTIQVLIASSNNLLEVYDIPRHVPKAEDEDELEYNKIYSLESPGHRTDVRALALSSDDRMLASASAGSLKIWNVQTGACLRTLESGYALSCTFLPGDKIVLLGTKSGDLELFDISSSTLIDKIKAHEGAVWALQLHPDGRSCITGGADSTVKFWTFQVVREDVAGTKRTTSRLQLSHNRSLKLSDDILSLCFSPDSRLLAVSTLDQTVKVFFVDSLKLFLNLYGHKLPVISMSISSDSKLLATSSADKTIRLWGLDFGDCHKALLGHTDSIMAVRFILEPANTDENHFFFSASKDGHIKSWDGDKFEQVQKLDGHHGEIWSMVTSKTGDFVVTASHDKSIRVWKLTDDPIFLEEEREKEMEQLYEQTLTTSLENDEDEDEQDMDGAVAASKQTVATLTAGEKIVEALSIGIEDLEIMADWSIRKQTVPNLAPPQRETIFLALGNISAERHVLNTLSKIPAAQLQDALLVLPFSVLPSLFTFLTIWIRKQWNIVLTCRVLFFMLKSHQRQIVTSKELKIALEDVRRELRKSLGEMKDLMGYNLAALGSIEQRIEENGIVLLEDVETNDAKPVKKRGFVDLS